MKTDKELVRLAAKAAGLEIKLFTYDGTAAILEENSQSRCGVSFNPLFDDGDALRLAVNLGIQIIPGENYIEAVKPSSRLRQTRFCEMYSAHDNQLAATRRAIVKAAAEIGESVGEIE